MSVHISKIFVQILLNHIILWLISLLLELVQYMMYLDQKIIDIKNSIRQI